MKKLRYFCETCLVASAAWLLPRMPRGLILALARGIGSLAYLLDARGRRTALENLRAAFGDAFSEKRRAAVARGSYQNFARTFLDLFWSARLTRENWPEHVTIHHGAEDAEARARRVGALWVTPHFGNFELASLFWGFRDFKFTVVAQDFKNPALTGIFKRLREHSGHTVIPQQGAMLRLMKTLKRQGHAALLTDLNVEPGRAATVIECFGLKTCVTTLHVQLARRLGLAIIPGVCLPMPDGRYEVHIFEAIEPADGQTDRQLAQRVWDHFEKAIREHPERWLWMYKHWRYQPARGRDPAYPDYAKANGDFWKMVEGTS
ncbi:MAG TPA: lysophospholipid acyltransferase family protein [Prosthecobacter sp.]|nr:lysophospholipid acyltransferase family protein [Prosthecobacter sp.]HRK15963.1 lysophospholipid acyltransferase family protein [Prosthecobacter sp.]